MDIGYCGCRPDYIGSNIELIDESGSRGWRDRRSAVRGL